MGIGNISIDPEAIITCGNQITSEGELYNKEVTKIYGIVDDLKTAWTGTSSQRFVDDIESFRQDYEKFGKLIVEVGGVFTDVGSQYKNLEENL